VSGVLPRSRRRLLALVITSEHGGNRVPGEYRPLFRGQQALLQTHRGHDPGSLQMARDLARHFKAPLVHSTVTRLLVELNRSLGHPSLFSTITRRLPRAERERIVERYYLPYRDEVEHRIARAIASGRRVVHVSSHSFTPVLDGELRNADIGLLYDPARPGERALARRWRRTLRERDGNLRVRFNYPYSGKADGLTTQLRCRFAPRDYLGIELEVNQRFPLAGGRDWGRLRRIVLGSLEDALD
jgi:predicted N-formylglutamate amidohydrolase